MALRSTLLELVEAVSDYSETDAETVAAVVHQVNSGQVQLCGILVGRGSTSKRPPSRWLPDEGHHSRQLRSSALLDVGIAGRRLGAPGRELQLDPERHRATSIASSGSRLSNALVTPWCCSATPVTRIPPRFSQSRAGAPAYVTSSRRNMLSPQCKIGQSKVRRVAWWLLPGRASAPRSEDETSCPSTSLRSASSSPSASSRWRPVPPMVGSDPETRVSPAPVLRLPAQQVSERFALKAMGQT